MIKIEQNVYLIKVDAVPLQRPNAPSRAQITRTRPGILLEARPCESCWTRVLSTSSGCSKIAEVNPERAPKRSKKRAGGRRSKSRFTRCFVSCSATGLAEDWLMAYQRQNAVRGSLICPLRTL